MKTSEIGEIAETSKRFSYHHGDLRAALLKSAEMEISDKGIEAFSLRGVAKRTGVSHAAPSHHFGDARGLLTALATVGFQRLLGAQEKRQRLAPSDPGAQLAASGLGYIDFAIENPALFRLMFSSERPDTANSTLEVTSGGAFDKLLRQVHNMGGVDTYSDPASMANVMATWAMVHGLADLLIGTASSLTNYFDNMSKLDREAVLSDMILRASSFGPKNE